MNLNLLEIETERLKLRPLTMDDVEAIYQIWIDAGVRKYLWDDTVISREETSSVIAKSLEYFRAKDFGLWAVLPRDQERIIGFCGYWFFHEPPQLELLYGIITDQWGKGFAPEAAKAMLRLGFEEFGFQEVIASTDAPNTASVRVMEKLGMSFLKRQDSEGHDTIYFSIQQKNFSDADSRYAVKGDRSNPGAQIKV
jgi:[ribosomal protein S5]-alanine N-acetyltransferase